MMTRTLAMMDLLMKTITSEDETLIHTTVTVQESQSTLNPITTILTIDTMFLSQEIIVPSTTTTFTKDQPHPIHITITTIIQLLLLTTTSG